MSTLKGIFEPFKPYVQNQLNLRRKILFNKNIGFNALPMEYFAYSGKQCTIRMASGVNVRGNTENPSALLDQSSDYESKLNGSALARNWILEGGMTEGERTNYRPYTEKEIDENLKNAKLNSTKLYLFQGVPFAESKTTLFDSENNEVFNMELYEKAVRAEIEFDTEIVMGDIPVGEKATSISNILRKGVGVNGAYGDPKLRANRDGEYGLVPMPGITDAEIRTKSDDGSLREAVVNFRCHNRRQLEILEALYMRPGYPLLLEWGWNPYISNYGSIENQMDVLDEFFDGTKDMTELNQQINKRKFISGGNYDGFIGYCKNFSFKVTPDGGYECTSEIMAHGEILESLKMAKVVISNQTDENNIEAEVTDKFLFFLKSMKKNLERAGDDKYINIKNTSLEDVSFGRKALIYGKRLFLDGLFGFWTAGDEIDQEVEDKKAENIIMEPIIPKYEQGFMMILDLIQNIMKVSQKDLEKEKKVNPRSLKYGYDSFLYGTFMQEISMVKDKFLKKEEDNEMSGKDKNIYVRWDMLCQIINHLCTPSYKAHGEPMVELTYINPNQKVYNMTSPIEDGPIDQSIATEALNGIADGRGRYYLDYSLPSNNKLHPIVDDDDLKKMLGQSFDYGVCIMPHQFDESLIVSKYDSKSYEKVVVKKQEEAKEEFTAVFSNLEPITFDGEYMTDPYENIRQYIDESENEGVSAAQNEQAQTIQNEEENYKPLTSFTDVTFTNQSIGLVYFNLDHLLKRYSEMRLVTKTINDKKVTRLKKEFSFLDFITKIWEDVNEACAGYYDFSVQTEHEQPHKARIIDKTTSGNNSFNIFEFDPQGLSSQLRDFNFSSKISSDIADVISIAAGAPNEAKSLDAVSFKSFHKNIQNRFTSDELDPQKQKEDQEAAKIELETDLKSYEAKFQLLRKYQIRANNQYRVTIDEDDGETNLKGDTVVNIDSATAIELAKDIEDLCISINSRFPLEDADGNPHPKAGQINVNATHERNAIIPLEFALQMDGISGISPLNLFKINKERLPLGYQREDIAFIVKGESQKITAGQDWTTELNGQLTLLNTNQVDEGKNIIPEKISKPTKTKEEENKEKLDKLDEKNPETPPIPDGEDPSPIINPDEIGKVEAFNTKLYKKYKFDVGFGRKGATAADSTFAKIKPYISSGDLVLVGDNATDSKFLKASVLTTTILTDGKFYLHKGCAGKFKSWMADLDSKGVKYQISAALRWGKNTGAGPHGYGLAVDFNNLYQDAKTYAKNPKKYDDITKVAANLEARKNSSTYKQIAESGKKFGFYNPWRLADGGGSVDELWHFEYWGDPA